MQLQWLGQLIELCPPGTVRDPSGFLCIPIPAGIDPSTVPGAIPFPDAPTPVPPPVVVVPSTTAADREEKRNRNLLIVGGIVAAGIIAAVVLS